MEKTGKLIHMKDIHNIATKVGIDTDASLSTLLNQLQNEEGMTVI